MHVCPPPLQEVKEFQAREKFLSEEKAKKVAVLESELRSFRANVDELALKFDEALQVSGVICVICVTGVTGHGV